MKIQSQVQLRSWEAHNGTQWHHFNLSKLRRSWLRYKVTACKIALLMQLFWFMRRNFYEMCVIPYITWFINFNFIYCLTNQLILNCNSKIVFILSQIWRSHIDLFWDNFPGGIKGIWNFVNCSTNKTQSFDCKKTKQTILALNYISPHT